MPFRPPSQGVSDPAAPIVDTVIPNPKLKLLDQMREVMRLKHYSIRTERTYCDWLRRYVHFHQMQTREEMLPAEPKIEAFLSHLAVSGNVAVSTQNQAFNALLFVNRIAAISQYLRPKSNFLSSTNWGGGSISNIIINSPRP